MTLSKYPLVQKAAGTSLQIKTKGNEGHYRPIKPKGGALTAGERIGKAVPPMFMALVAEDVVYESRSTSFLTSGK
jgi:hypothetical protein